MSEQPEFKPSEHADAYDFRGNRNPASPEWAPQTEPVAGETEGYHAPGGGVRQSIRERIAKVRPYTLEQVEVPEWDSTIEVRSITLGERQAMMQDLMDENGDVDLQLIEAHYIVKCCFDPETGERVFADDDVEFIQNLPAGLADKVGHVAVKLSGMSEATKEAEAKKSSTTES